MIDCHVQTHANGIGRDKVVHLPVLVESDLCVTGAGGKLPHDHRTPATFAADKLGNGVHLGHGKSDNGSPWWQAGQTCMSRIAQTGQTGACFYLYAPDQRLHEGGNRICTEEQGLGQSPCV